MEHIGRALGNTFGSTTATRKVADDYHQQALAYQKQGRLDKAQEQYGKALAMGQEAQRINPKKSKVYRTLAAISLDYADLLERQHRTTEAKDVYQQAQQYVDEAHKLEPKHPKVQDLLRTVNSQRSQFLRAQGQTAQADQALEKMVQSLQIQQSPASNRSGMAEYFSSSSSWLPSRLNSTQGHLFYPINNPAFDTHLSSLSLCAKPFFTQPLQANTQPTYVLPQPGEPIQDTHYLAWCLRQNTASQEDKAAWIEEAKGVIEQFSQIKIKGLAHVQEVVAFATLDHPQLHRSLTSALLNALEENRLLNLALLQGLSVMVLHRTHLTEDRHSIGDYVQVLQVLLGLLERIHADQNPEQAQTLFHTLSFLLDQMVYLQVKEIDRIKIEVPLKTALNRFADEKKYPELEWPIQYIQQALARLPNNEAFSEALIRRVLPMLGGVSYLTTFGLKVASAEIFISGFEPDKLWEAYQCFKEVFAIGRSRCAPWYGELRFVDVLMGLGKLELVEQLLEANTGQRDVSFLRGLCDRLERIASVQHDAQARDSALRLLKGIEEGKIEWAPQESIQQYARQSLNRVALMWPTPDMAAMERNGYAPAAWHPFWSEQTSSLLLNRIQDKAQRHAKQEAMQYHITSLASHSQQMQSLLSPAMSLADLRTALYQHYQLSDLSIQRVSGERASVDTCYINLAIVESLAQHEKDQEILKRQVKAFERLPSNEQLAATNPNKLIALDKLFEPQTLLDGSIDIPKRILIQGRAGIGKTTLCKKLVYEYYHNGLWQDRFTSMLWVPLRQLKTAPPKRLENLLCDRYFMGQESRQAQALSKAFHTHQDETLFILDGLDEVVGELEEGRPLKGFLQTLLNQTHVVITSRPAGVNAHLLGQLDLELETVGFSSENVQAYVQMFVPESNQAAISQFINRTTLIQGLVNIPIQLDALCYSWDKLPENQELVTMAMLYEAMVHKLWQKDSRRLEKGPLGEILSESDLEELMAPEVNYLSYLAFKGLEAGKIEFSLNDLSQRRKELNNIGASLPLPFTYGLKKTSYLHTADAERPEAERHYHFLHLTFQEFFAAKHLVQHFQTYSETTGLSASSKIAPTHSGLMLSLKELEIFMAQQKYNPRYEIVWWMVAGLLKGAALEHFFTLLEATPRDLIGGRHQQIMMGCLNEARSQLSPTKINQLEAELVQWLRFELKPNEVKLSELGRQRTFPEHLLLIEFNQLESKKEKIIDTLSVRPVLSDAAIQALSAALQDKKSNVRALAAHALGEQKMLSEAATQALSTALQDKEEYVRWSIAQAFSKQKTLSNTAIQALNAALEDEDADVRSAAAQALNVQKTIPDTPIQDLSPVLQVEDKDVELEKTGILVGQQMLADNAILLLIVDLQHDDGGIRSTAVRELSKQQTLPDNAIQALIATLQDEAWLVRFAAAEALGQQPTLPDNAIQTLIAALQDEAWLVRSAAAEILGKQPTLPDNAIQALIATLQNEGRDMQSAAAKALGQQPTLPDNAIQALIAALQNEVRDVRSVAAEALGQQPTLPDNAIQALIAALQDESPDVRSAAAETLGKQPTLPDNAIQVLIAALQDEDCYMGSAAAKVLGQQPTLPDNAIQTLIAALQGETWLVRSVAAEALGQQPTLPDNAIQALIAALQDEGPNVRSAAAKALGGQQPTLHNNAIQALIAALQDEAWLVRSAAAEILGKQPTLPDNAIQALIAALQDEDRDVQSAAAKALGGQQPTLPDNAIQALIAALQNEVRDVRSAAAEALGQQPTLPDNAIQALIAALQDKAWRVRSAAAQILGGHQEALIAALQDENQNIRSAAIDVLGKQQPLPDNVIQALIAALQDETWEVRSTAAEVLGQQPTLPDNVIQALIAALQDKARRVRSAAAETLGQQPMLPDNAIQALLTTLQDKEKDVRSAAVQAFYKQKMLTWATTQALIPFELQNQGSTVIHSEQKALPDAIIQALISRLQVEEWRIQSAAAEALYEQKMLSWAAIQALIPFDLQNKNKSVHSTLINKVSEQKSLPDPVIQALISRLQTEDKSVSSAAIKALGEQKTLPSFAIQALITALQNEKWNVRYAATQVFSEQKNLPHFVIQALISRLQDKNEYVRPLAAKALAKQKALPEAVIQTLISVLQDKKCNVQSEVIKILGEQKTMPGFAIQALILALQNDNWEIRNAATKALGEQKILPDNAIRALINALQDEDDDVMGAAVYALESHLDQLYLVLPNLELEPLQSLYTQVLFPQSCKRIAPLYIEDNRLYFYTAAGLGHSAPLRAEQIAVMTEAFSAIQAEIQVPPKSSFFPGEGS
ncbi:MAG: HEAT repeat [Glomeribacter sp. 1016415]|nr:HEAT repeat [Glomeribacter sp. 1016415]